MTTSRIRPISLKQLKTTHPSTEQTAQLLTKLQQRGQLGEQFSNWPEILERLVADDKSLRAVFLMDITGGEPTVLHHDLDRDLYVVVDCSPQTPTGRRHLCYDRKAELTRRSDDVRPAGNVLDMAEAIGVEVLTEQHYEWLQTFVEVDTKTSSWLKTPENIRSLGGALFGEKRYGRVFIYHNGANAFFKGRGFRGFVTF